ncbi:MAG TPA: 50S ribosomal protein L29 [Clostridiales bacterium]|nr:50S ribosomal protein L29 [Clostridiales bacterium]HBJ97496.1 50S ribosomal protein L29 [Clostridiales bacterium]
MKAKEIREMTNNELLSKLDSLKEELFNLRFRHATGQLENPLTLSLVRKDIARIKTEIREREIKAKA